MSMKIELMGHMVVVHRLDSDHMVRDGKILDTSDKRRDSHSYHSSFGSNTHDDRYHYHPYKRNDRGYFPDEFKKAKPPTFHGYLNKMKDTEAWLLGVKKFFELHDYIENMKSIIAIFSLKGKA